MPLVGRVSNLLRGLAARWVGRREQRHPDAVYVAAIEERVTQYAKLREAAAGIIYLRSKLAKELERESAELGRVRRQLEIAVERDDDTVALHLIGRRDTLGAEVTRLTAELTELTKERSEERRVGKECGSRRWRGQCIKKSNRLVQQ